MWSVHCRGWDTEGDMGGEHAAAENGLDLEQLNDLQTNSSASSDDKL